MAVGRVSNVSSGSTCSWVELTTSSGVLCARRAHPFWVECRRNLHPASELVPGMSLVSEGGERIQLNRSSLRPVDGSEPTYNFSVDGTHNYFAGERNSCS